MHAGAQPWLISPGGDATVFTDDHQQIRQRALVGVVVGHQNVIFARALKLLYKFINYQ